MNSKSGSGFNTEISTQRLEAFSDGVFAIAITLLILEIKIPTYEDLEKANGLGNYLMNIWPDFFAYVFSFIIIGIYWARHHYLFKLFRRTDHTFNLLNVLFLMFIAFLPYPTALLGDFIKHEAHIHSVVSFYAAAILAPAICWNIIWSYGRYRYRLINHHLDEAFLKKLSLRFYSSLCVCILAFITSFFYPVLSLVINIGLSILYLVPPTPIIYKPNAQPVR